MNISGPTPLSPLTPPPSSGIGTIAPGGSTGSISGQTSLTGKGPANSSVPPVKSADAAQKSNSDDRYGKTTKSDGSAARLDEAQLDELRSLKARDREVRAHELAHQAVGGQYAGAVSYTFQRGPDGAQYAVGGEVSIDVAPISGDPAATIQKMRIVRAAALAPSQPSGQDRAVAAQAMQLMLLAQTELATVSRSAPDEADGASLTRVSDSTRSAGEVTRVYGRIAREDVEQNTPPGRASSRFQAIA